MPLSATKVRASFFLILWVPHITLPKRIVPRTQKKRDRREWNSSAVTSSKSDVTGIVSGGIGVRGTIHQKVWWIDYFNGM